MPEGPPGAGAATSAGQTLRLVEAPVSPLQVGLGNVLFLRGAATDPKLDPVSFDVRLGSRPGRLLDAGLPAPGETRGAESWVAVVPVGPIAAVEQAPIEALLASGGIVPLGAIELAPGGVATLGSKPRPGRVAICMATFQPDPSLFEAQIESIRAQTHDDWICLISDDCSSSARWREMLAIVGEDERFQLMRAEARAGFFRNFERALGMVPADAETIALADQDDRWYPEKLEVLLEEVQGGAVIAHSDAKVAERDGSITSPTLWPQGFPPDQDLADVLHANAISGAAMMFRAELLARILPFPNLPGPAFHDRWIALVATASGRVARVDQPLYDYVQHEGAVLGHSGLAGGRRSTLSAGRERLGEMLSGNRRPNLRPAYELVLRSIGEAIVLELRLGSELADEDRRELRAMASLLDSNSAQARLLARHLRSPRAPGVDAALVRGLAWPRAARARLALDRTRASRPGVALRDHLPRRLPRSSAAPRQIAITASPDESFGDFHVARGLGEALGEMGYEVAYVDGTRVVRDAAGADVVISLLDRYPIDHLPSRVVKVAWARNWADRWAARSWLDEFDLLFASSPRAAEVIAAGAGREVATMPLATDPRRFRPLARDPQLECDLLFVGSYWGSERAIASVLPELAGSLRVSVFGRGWEEVPGMSELQQGAIAGGRLPAAYCSAGLVVDDSGAHAAPYGAVNSRVFDALACAADVASNDAEGVGALLSGELPVWTDADSLAAAFERCRRERAAGGERVKALQAEVLADHTFARRASQIDEALRERALI